MPWKTKYYEIRHLAFVATFQYWVKAPRVSYTDRASTAKLIETLLKLVTQEAKLTCAQSPRESEKTKTKVTWLLEQRLSPYHVVNQLLECIRMHALTEHYNVKGFDWQQPPILLSHETLARNKILKDWFCPTTLFPAGRIKPPVMSCIADIILICLGTYSTRNPLQYHKISCCARQANCFFILLMHTCIYVV